MSTGEAAQVTCLVSTGDQPLKISWSFEGHSLKNLRGVSTTQIGKKASMLLIDPVGAEHRGNYTCTVKNPAGVANFTAALYINGNSSKIIHPISLFLFFLVKLTFSPRESFPVKPNLFVLSNFQS